MITSLKQKLQDNIDSQTIEHQALLKELDEQSQLDHPEDLQSIKLQNTKLISAVAYLRSEMAAKEKKTRKLLKGAVKEKFKQDAKIEQMGQLVKELELDNEKLRQSLMHQGGDQSQSGIKKPDLKES